MSTKIDEEITLLLKDLLKSTARITALLNEGKKPHVEAKSKATPKKRMVIHPPPEL